MSGTGGGSFLDYGYDCNALDANEIRGAIAIRDDMAQAAIGGSSRIGTGKGDGRRCRPDGLLLDDSL